MLIHVIKHNFVNQKINLNDVKNRNMAKKRPLVFIYKMYYETIKIVPTIIAAQWLATFGFYAP